MLKLVKNNVVSRTGDTMTGNLEVNGTIVSGPGANTDFNVVSKIMTWADAPVYFEGAVYSSANATNASGFLFSRARGSYASKAAVAADDRMFFVVGRGYDGATFQNPVAITGKVDGAVSDGVVPGRIAFETSATNSAARAERLVIKSDGKIGIGNASPGALLDIGLAGTTLGVIRLEGSTSGYAALQPTAAAGSVTITFPATTGTVMLVGGSHTTLSDIGTNTHAQIDTAISNSVSHIANTSNPHSVTLAQVGGTTDHTALSNIGTNSHSAIDTFIGTTVPATYAPLISPSFTTPILGVASATSLAVPALTTASGAMSITPAAGSNLNIALSTTGDLAVNTSQLYVDTSEGRVGINTATPAARLEVNETTAATNANIFVTARQENELRAQIFFLAKNSAGGLTGGTIGSDGSRGSELAFMGTTGGIGTPHMVLDSSGRLGIGNTDPGFPLTISNTNVTNGQLELRSQRAAIVTNNVLGGIEFRSNDTDLTAPGTVVAAMRVTAAGSHGATSLNTAFGFYVTDTNTIVLNSYPAIYIQPSNLVDLRRDSTNVTAFGTAHLRLQNLDATAATSHLINVRFDFYDTTGGTNRNAGGIIIGKEQEWTTTASTRDSFMSLHTSLDGTVGEKVRITSNGNVGIGTTTPTAYLHIKAGTASANTAPIKLTSGTLNTTPVAGCIEFDGTNLYFADSGGTRRQLAVV